jgi:hypothetical protein
MNYACDMFFGTEGVLNNQNHENTAVHHIGVLTFIWLIITDTDLFHSSCIILLLINLFTIVFAWRADLPCSNIVLKVATKSDHNQATIS